MARYSFAICGLLALTFSACSAGGKANSSSPSQQRSAVRAPWKLIGKHIDDRAVKDYLARSSSKPDREIAPGYGVFISLYGDGVELSADTRGTITTVIIYSSRSRLYKEYSGPLPLSLSWNMSRSKVEQAIGSPEEFAFTQNSDTGQHEFYAKYPTRDVYLTYVAQSDSDMQAELLDIRIKNPDLK